MHIAVLYQYGHNPDCPAASRHWRLMEEWSQSHEVTLITSTAMRRTRSTYRNPWVPDGVRLVEIPLDYTNAMSVPGRLTAFAQFTAGLLRVTRHMEAPDVVLASSTPLTVAWAGSVLARRWKIPWVFEVCDLWPEFPIQMGVVPRALQSPLRGFERALYDRADRVIAFSPDMTAHIADMGFEEKTETTYGGTEASRFDRPDVHDIKQSRKLTLLYAGTLGRANAIPLLLETAERLSHRADHEFVFLGDGYYREQVQNAADKLGNVRFLGTLPLEQTAYWFRRADLSLVSFEPLPVLAANSPSKIYDSLASGTPALVTNSGWTRDLVERNGVGWYCPSADAVGFSRCVASLIDQPLALQAAGERAYRLARHSDYALMFDRNAQARQYEKVFLDVTGNSERAGENSAQASSQLKAA